MQEVFSKSAADKLPQHGSQDHVIDLTSSKPSFGPLYNLLATELGVLQDYLNENLVKGFIHPLTSPAGAPILFVKKKDSTL